MREALMLESQKKVRKGRFFTLFAPRQAGKTTFFKLLLNELEKDFTTVWISFENLKTASKADFYQELNYELRQELSRDEISSELTINGPISLRHFFDKPRNQAKPIVLVIDEFEGIPDCVLSEVFLSGGKISD
jgi:predicted AAA+ superfamily ATPase